MRPKTAIPSTAQGAELPDLERFRLRRFLASLDETELERVKYTICLTQDGNGIFVKQTVADDDAGLVQEQPGRDQQTESHDEVKHNEAPTVSVRGFVQTGGQRAPKHLGIKCLMTEGRADAGDSGNTRHRDMCRSARLQFDGRIGAIAGAERLRQCDLLTDRLTVEREQHDRRRVAERLIDERVEPRVVVAHSPARSPSPTTTRTRRIRCIDLIADRANLIVLSCSYHL
ncbi:hypothetical protein [Paraburkholderia diazotrophica]|uniref:hypothetical protein n=1 Tax=Paraburkholderia diazotrophica TaxID=667676 RepID=UPI0031723FE8